MDSIKITALTPIGGNIAYTTLIPVVNMAGTPLTQRATAQVLGNLILNSAGGSYFPPAAQAVLAQSVTNAAQPNITSTGTLTALNVTGNIVAGNINGGNIMVANFYYGDGGFLSNISGNGGGNANTGNITFSGSNITTNATSADINIISNTDGNVSLIANNHIFVAVDDTTDPHGGIELTWSRTDTGVTSTAGLSINSDYGNSDLATGNVQIIACSNLANGLANSSWTFGYDGSFYLPGVGEKALLQGPMNELFIHSDTHVHIVTDIYDSSRQFIFDSTGDFYAPGNVTMAGTRINIGPGANAVSLTGPSIVSKGSAPLVQMAIFNDLANGSSDYLMYGAGGDESQGWGGIGFNGPEFNFAQYSLTRPGDIGFFVQGYANGIGGNMILATGNEGLGQDIIFGLGGFTLDTEFARFSASNNAFELNRANAALSTPPSDAYTIVTPTVGVMTNTAQWSNAVPTLNNSKGCWTGTGTSADDVILYTIVDNLTPNIAEFYTDAAHTIPYNLPAGLFGAPGYFDYGTKAFDLFIKGGPAVSVDKGLGGDIVLIASDGVPTEWRFTTEGNLYAPGNVILSGETVLVGPGAETLLAGLEGATLIISANNQAIVQAVIENVSDVGSADWVAQGHYGNDAGGWTDLGFNSVGFNDPEFTMTGPGDGYLLAEAFLPGQAPAIGGGNLILATGENGTTKDIIFGTGGFLAADIFGRISHANNALELSRSGSGLKFADGSTQTTAYTGGGGNTGNVTFANVTVQGVNGLNLSAGADFTANLAFLQVRAGDFPSHIHFDTGNNAAYDLIIGDDSKFVQVSSTGNILMSSYDGATNYQWNFDNTGNLTIPGNISNANVIVANTVQTNVVAYAALPAATTAGKRAFINDANLVAAGNFGATVGSGGSNTVPVYSDGTNWCIG